MLKRKGREQTCVRGKEMNNEGGMQRNIGRRERAISTDEIQFLFLFLVQRITCQITVLCSMLQSTAQQVRVLGSGGLQPPHLLALSGSVSRRLPPRSTTSRSLAPPSTAPPPRVWIPDRSTIILVLSTVETETKSKTDTETITITTRPLPTLASENLQRHNIGSAR